MAEDLESTVREGRFCAILFLTARKSLNLNAEDVRVVEGARLESVFCALNPMRLARRRHPFPLSLHLPVAPTEGSVARNLNKTGVRLWTACSGEMGRNPALLDARRGHYRGQL